MAKSKAGLEGWRCQEWRGGLKKIWRGVAVLALAFGLLLGTTAADRYDIKLIVTVTDCVTGQPIQEATVNVLSAATARGSHYLATTDARGQAVIEPVRVGDVDHTVEVSAAGYRTVTKSQYMRAWSTVEMNICLEPVAAPPTETPTLTPTLEATRIPSASSTPDEGQAARCGNYLAEQLKGLIAAEDSAVISGGINDVAQCMLQCRETSSQAAGEAAAPVESPGLAGTNYGQFYACFQSCADFGYFQNAAGAIIANDTLPGKIISTLAGLLSGAEGAQACGDSGAFVYQLVKQLAVQGAQVNILAVHSPANVWVTDKEGRRAGFFEDGRVVEDIPGARAVISGESKYVIIPVIPELKVDLKTSGKGTMTVELAYTRSGVVQDMAFYDVPIEPEATGSVNLTPSQPILELDTPGVGTQSVPPGRLEEIPVIPAPSKTVLSSATIEPVVLVTPDPEATATPDGLFNDPQLRIAGVAGAACCLGLLLAGVILGIVVWLRRRARRSGAQAVVSRRRECPRCGANCQLDARFCYKCGLSFVQAAQPPRPPAAPPRPAPVAPPPPPVACTKCGAALRATSKFCPKCGQPTGR